MTYVFLDLEWNSFFEPHKNKYISEIVDIGAVKVSEELKIIDEFHSFVKPKYSEKLNSYVERLTNIKTEDITSADLFEKVVEVFEDWIGGDAVIMTWSNSDLHVLLETYKEMDEHNTVVPFIHRYVDLQSFVQKQLGLNGGNQLGLSKAAELLGVDCSDLPAHSALNDSKVSALCFISCFDEKKLSQAIYECDSKEFYDRTFYKTKFLSTVDSELIKPSDLRYYCPYCKKQLKRKGKWKGRNRKLYVNMYCRGCDKKFTAYLQVKITFDDIVKTKNLREIVAKES